MKRFLDLCETTLLYISCFSVFVLMLLTTVDTTARYVFNQPITGAFEITSSYLMVAAIFFGVCYGYRGGSYIRVTFLVERLPGPCRLVIYYFVQIFSMLYSLTLVIATVQQARRVFADHTALSSVNVPLGPAYIIVTVGLCFMSLLMLLDIRKVRKGGSPLFKDDPPIG